MVVTNVAAGVHLTDFCVARRVSLKPLVAKSFATFRAVNEAIAHQDFVATVVDQEHAFDGVQRPSVMSPVGQPVAIHSCCKQHDPISDAARLNIGEAAAIERTARDNVHRAGCDPPLHS